MLKGSPLISPAEDKQPVHHFTINIDWCNKTSNLTFTMALSAFDALYFSMPPNCLSESWLISPSGLLYLLKFHILQVSLMGQNTKAQLTANHLWTIVAHNDSCIDGVALHKKFACIHSQCNPCYIEVFGWEQSTPLGYWKAVKLSKLVQTRLLGLHLDMRLWLQLMCCAHSQHKVPQFQDPQVKPRIWVENMKEIELLGKSWLIFKLQKTYKMLCFCNHVNLIAISNHHHHHNSDPRRYSCLLSSSSPSDYSDISLSQSPSYSEVTITLSSSSLAYWMSTLFGNHWQISPWSLYSTFGPLTCVSGYGHAQNDLLLLSHVYSMSQILLVVYSLHTSLYYPSFESRLSSSNLFPELSLSFVFATH